MPIASDISINPQINGVTLDANTTSVTVDIALSKVSVSLQTKVVGTAFTGTIAVLLSNDLVDFNDVTSQFAPALNQPSALTGNQFNFATIPLGSQAWAYARIIVTRSAGSAVVTASVRTRGV